MRNSQYILRTLIGLCLLLAGLVSCGQELFQKRKNEPVEKKNIEVAPTETPLETPLQTAATVRWMERDCWLSASLEIIAKIFPHTFANSTDPFATAVKAILPKLQQGTDGITGEETEEICKAFLEIFPQFTYRSANLLAFEDIIQKYSAKDSSQFILMSSDEQLNQLNSFRECFLHTLKPQSLSGKLPAVITLLSSYGNSFPHQPLFKIDLTTEECQGNGLASSYELIGFITLQKTTRHVEDFVAYTQSGGIWRCYNSSEKRIGTVSEEEAKRAAAKSVYYFYKEMTPNS